MGKSCQKKLKQFFKWIKNFLKLSVELTTDDVETKLSKAAAERGDTGIYEVKLKNSEGEDSIPVKITIVDKPAPCQGPLEATDVTKSTVTLNWKQPNDDGGSDLSGNILKKNLLYFN